MKKRIILLTIVSIFLLSIFGLSISAADNNRTTPYRYTNIQYITFDLAFSGTTGYVSGAIIGNSGVSHITGTVTLYYKNFWGNWIEIPMNWNYNVYDDSLDINESFTGTRGTEYKAVLSTSVYKNIWEDDDATDIATCPKK